MKPSQSLQRIRQLARFVGTLVKMRLIRAMCGLRRRPARAFGAPEALAAAAGGLRAGIGMAALCAPGFVAAPWVGVYESKRTSVRLFGRTLAGRDLALGLAVLRAYARHDRSQLADLVLAGAMADACDAVASIMAWRALPKGARPLVLSLSLSAASGGVAIGLAVRSRR